MIDIFSGLSKLFRYRKIRIDGNVFRLHCTLTVIILMAFVIIVSTKTIVGEPIHCDNNEVLPKHYLNSFCYIETTYSVGEHLNKKMGDIGVVYPGIAKPPIDGTDLVNHKYYQWIWCLLLFQAICFYFPRWLWKVWESGKMSSLVSDLSFFTKDEVKDKKKELIVEYLMRTRGENDWYAIKYFICEVLALFNVFAQIAINDWILSGGFATYGLDCVRYLLNDTNIISDPMTKLFPLLSKCHFKRYGPSGGEELIDTICILAINIYNEKIFLILWFWYYFLSIITVIVILFRFLLICCPIIRYYVCLWRFELSIKKGSNSSDLTQLIVRKLKIGDWFILHMLGQNIESVIFGEILEELVDKYKGNKGLNGNQYSVKNHQNVNEKNENSYL